MRNKNGDLGMVEYTLYLVLTVITVLTAVLIAKIIKNGFILTVLAVASLLGAWLVVPLFSTALPFWASALSLFVLSVVVYNILYSGRK